MIHWEINVTEVAPRVRMVILTLLNSLPSYPYPPSHCSLPSFNPYPFILTLIILLTLYPYPCYQPYTQILTLVIILTLKSLLYPRSHIKRRSHLFSSTYKLDKCTYFVQPYLLTNPII